MSSMVDQMVEEFVEAAKRSGLRITAQRVAIARIVFERLSEHPSFSEVLEAAKRSIPGVSASTVYNTLQLLEKLGFIQDFSSEGVTRYDRAYPHINVVCLDTGKVFDAPELADIVKVIGEKTNVRVKNIVVYAHCSREGSSGPG